MTRDINRRTFIASLLATPVLYELLTACGPTVNVRAKGQTGADSDQNGVSRQDGMQSLRSDRPRAVGTDPVVAAAAINAFGNDLLTTLAAQQGGEASDQNLVCSPASIAIALAMAMGGAAGDTLGEMASVLHANSGDGDIDSFHSSMNSVLAALAQRSRVETATVEPDEDPAEVQLDIANSLWGQAGFTWKPAFLDLLAEQYGAGLETVDYETDADAAAGVINRWVSEATNDRINDLIGKGQLDALTRLVLVNAVYFKANWQTEFGPNATKDLDFSTAAGEVVQVPTMFVAKKFRVASDANWTAVEIPYAFDELSMVVAVAPSPNNDGAPQIDDVVEQLSARDVLLWLPKFDIDVKVSLVDQLKLLGMPDAFSFDQADFSAMTTDDKLFIGDVIHQAKISVDEGGTEAAAATVVEMAAGAAPNEEEPPPPLEVRIDKPFTFWLRDRETGTVIFTGRVNDPRR